MGKEEQRDEFEISTPKTSKCLKRSKITDIWEGQHHQRNWDERKIKKRIPQKNMKTFKNQTQ